MFPQNIQEPEFNAKKINAKENKMNSEFIYQLFFNFVCMIFKKNLSFQTK